MVVTPGVEVISDTAVEVDPQGKTVRLASGRIEPYDALLLATGSTPRLLPDTLPGLTAATEAGRVTTLHSLEDAVAVRDLLGTLGRPAQIVISGAGRAFYEEGQDEDSQDRAIKVRAYCVDGLD